jgi:6-phosphogluconolactonase
MTLPIINNARNVVIVASGPGKTAIVSKALDPTSTVPDLPIRRVSPSNGELWWFVDRAAVPGDPEMLAPERPMTG